MASIPEFPNVPADLFIGGEWRPSSGGERFAVSDPSDASTLVEVASATADDMTAAVQAAHEAQPAWAATSPRERAEVLRRAFEIMTAERDQIARLIVQENGKALADATAEATYATEFFRWFAEEAVRLDGRLTTAPSGANRIIAIEQPVGVALLVTPWNFPAAMATRKIGPALASGSTCVLKPASATPLTALAMADVLSRAGAPAGTVNVLAARSASEVTNAALDDERVRKVSFTGSTKVGSILLGQASQRIVKASMELGGNAPLLVFADADMDTAVSGAMLAKMRNGGASCISANRILVETSVADEFAERMAAEMAKMTMGPGLESGSKLGPMINEAERDKIHKLVTQGVDDGGEVLTGGEIPDRPGWFYPATVLKDVPSDSPMLAEEIFGPVAPITTFTDEDQAVAMANDTPYGLASYVFTEDLGRGLRVSERIDSGMVGLNRGFISDVAAPFGGTKQSGLGREGGHVGIFEFTETKYIAADW